MRTFLLLIIISLTSGSLYGQMTQKNRVIILTDIEADPDDTQSLVRLLLYSNEIDGYFGDVDPPDRFNSKNRC